MNKEISDNMSTTTNPKELPAKLKELRHAHGYTQFDVAASIGIKQGTYSNYETGKRSPSTVAIYRIANFYGMPADDLLKMCFPLDEDIFYDAPAPTDAAHKENDFIQYMKSAESNPLSREDKELLFHFSRLTPADKQEVIDFAAFKRQRRKPPVEK